MALPSPANLQIGSAVNAVEAFVVHNDGMIAVARAHPQLRRPERGDATGSCLLHTARRCVLMQSWSGNPRPWCEGTSPDMTGEATSTLDYIEWQRVLFAPLPRRSELLKLRPSWPCRKVTIRVHRNEPFEYVSSALPPYLAYAGLSADFDLSGYDNALEEIESRADADLHLFWIDFSQYGQASAETLVDWLSGRVAALRARTASPIVVANDHGDAPGSRAFNKTLAQALEPISGVRVYDRASVAAKLGSRYRDARMKALAGSDLSDAANMVIARELGSSWFPAALGRQVKVIALDLDGTLYSGVLGEDGVEGVVLTPEHGALQRELCDLQGRGVLLAVVSRNIAEDVEALFARRSDFPLHAEHFAAVVANWNEKAQSIAQIAGRLHVGTDSVVFVDDNPGELLSVAQALPEVRVLYAADPANAATALELYPGLMSWAATAEDSLRTQDLRAIQARDKAVGEAAHPEEYLRSLQTHLEFRLNPTDLAGRLSQLSMKTNQFNLAVKRYNEPEVIARLSSPDAAVVSIALSDRLSDSGVIGAVFGRRVDSTLLVEELCISCRALGRSLESEMLASALEEMRRTLGVDRVEFEYAQAPRNAPGLQWLQRASGRVPDRESGRIALDSESLARLGRTAYAHESWA
jgi:FkbH-like protein